mgnify:CR=1 FL=1
MKSIYELIKDVTRIEVIDWEWRQYTKWNTKIDLSFQDNGKTLKVFVQNTPQINIISPLHFILHLI